ncbi:MAG: helix-turn-helix transcriptional regulator [Myxococcales bacterium]|nr:helix-turn-helix transcriptional regulator [Myxococcales bacterium]
MRDDSLTVNTEAEVLVLDGVWLRRERERIAIGRRQVAERLGVPESQVIRVEMNKRPIPPGWFAGLAALGFPIPEEAPPQTSRQR